MLFRFWQEILPPANLPKKIYDYPRQKYMDIFEFAPIGIYRSNAKGNILTANIALAKILGYSSIQENTRT